MQSHAEISPARPCSCGACTGVNSELVCSVRTDGSRIHARRVHAGRMGIYGRGACRWWGGQAGRQHYHPPPPTRIIASHSPSTHSSSLYIVTSLLLSLPLSPARLCVNPTRDVLESEAARGKERVTGGHTVSSFLLSMMNGEEGRDSPLCRLSTGGGGCPGAR